MRRALLLLLALAPPLSARADDPPAVDGTDAAGWAERFEAKAGASDARFRLGAAGKAAAPIAAALLEDRRPEVRGWAAWVVDALGANGVELRPKVLVLLGDPDASVREEAMGAASSMTDTLGEALVEPTRRILREDEWRAQGRAASVLAALGVRARDAIPDLVHALTHVEPYVADDVARALLSMGPFGVEALARAWKGAPEKSRAEAREGVEDGVQAAAADLVALLASKEEDVVAGAEALCLAAGWGVLPALDGAWRAATGPAVERLARVRREVLAEAVRTLAQPGEEDLLVLGEPIPIDPSSVEMRWESGSGHGSSLALYRTTRSERGLAVRTIAYSGRSLSDLQRPDSVVVRESAPIDPLRWAAACETLSHLLAARLTERPRKGSWGAWGSSGDYHARLRVFAAEKILFDETFTGYPGSGSNRKSFRVDAADKVLGGLLGSAHSQKVPADANDRAFVASRLTSIATDEWWVRERLLRIVAGVGDASFEPALRAFIGTPPEEYPWDHVAAIDAYAELTGVDLRTKPFERKDVPGVRDRYLSRFHGRGPAVAPRIREERPDPEAYPPLPEPRPGDWLASHPEPGQTFEQFAGSRRRAVTDERRKVYVRMLDDPAGMGVPESALLDHLAAYFGLPAEPALGDAPPAFSTRGRAVPQTLTTDVLRWLPGQVPSDAYCLLAVTTRDLYAGDDWNFVYGQASLFERVGVFSFARMDPAFPGPLGDPAARDAASRALLLRRCLKVVTHEVGHMLGLEHCTAGLCLMNGSNGASEMDRTPLHLCPVCVKKVAHACDLDVLDRWRRLESFYGSIGLDDERTFAARRIARLTESKPR